MRTIWKYPLDVADRQSILMPGAARVLSAQTQRDGCFLWAVVEPDAPQRLIAVHIAGTGHPLPGDIDQFRYVGTMQISAGALVFHVFVNGA